MASFPLKVVTWGPADAKRKDLHFVDKFVEPDGVHKALDPNVWLVTGEKGAGKTAIRRALLEKTDYANRYTAIVTVDFDDLSFHAIYKELQALAAATSVPKLNAMSNLWRYSLIVELIFKASEVTGSWGPYTTLVRSLERTGDTRDASPLVRITKQIERIWDKLDEFTAPNTKPANKAAGLLEHGGLRGKVIDDIMRFPLDERFRKLMREFGALLERHDHRVIAILDGFDRLRSDGAPHDGVRLIFDSLVDAVYSLHVDPDRSERIEIKALIPHDRYLNVSLRDSDKIDSVHSRITWDYTSLQQFLARRMELSSKLHGESFRTLWRQVMPERVQNTTHRLEEDTFEFILRHTLYRPRHLQVHLEGLARETEDTVVDPSIVPKVLEHTCRKLAGFFLNEYQTDIPYLRQLLGVFKNKCNVMEYRDFRKLVAGTPGSVKESIGSIEELVDMLYMMGTFGVVYFPGDSRWPTAAYTPPSRQAKNHYVDFFFKIPRSSVSVSLDDTTLVALHPILSDELRLKPHPDLIVG